MTRVGKTDSYISFYLKANRIHIFVNALRDIGEPKRICFLLDDNGETLVIIPHGNRDLISHSVPRDIYRGMKCMEVCSKKLCQLLAALHGWNPNFSYRIPGIVDTDQRIAKYNLIKAQPINVGKSQ